MADSSAPEKAGEIRCQCLGLGCPQVLGILTTDPIANRTPMASQAVAGLFQYWGPARAAISGRSLASTMLEQIGQMLTSAFANRLLAAVEEPPTAQ